MPKRLLWLSRHGRTAEQEAELKKFFNDDVQIVDDSRVFTDAGEIIDRINDGKFDDIVYVGPYSVANELVRRGKSPILAKGHRQGRKYHFRGFERFKGILSEPLQKAS